MMRSMYSGVSGLRVHQVKMDVIGNNIANVNTIGFKKSQVGFQEAFSQVMRGAGSPHGGKGGTNPQQIGLGMKLGSISTVHTKGATQRTDNPTDLMIDGEGFFMVSDDQNAQNIYYTRAGNFTFDLYGNLVTADGYKLLGEFIGDEDYANYMGIDSAKDIDSIKISKSIPAPAMASSKVEIKGNIDSRLPDYEDDSTTPATINKEGVYTTDTTIKDSLGNSYKVSLRFEKTENDNEWLFSVPEVKDISNNSEIPGITLGDQTITFDSSGNIDPGCKEFSLDFSGYTGTAEFGSFADHDSDPSTDLTYNNIIGIDLSKITQFANTSDAKGFDVEDENGQVGKESGSLTGFAINNSGKLIASFSNGVKKELWQIKTANFDNPAGLVKSGSNFFDKTPNSGEPKVGIPGNGGLGSINPGTLEMSNVDLSSEFTEMISTQRGFQANSRIITTTDEMLQELTNMKR